jgi:hypothetical protein
MGKELEFCRGSNGAFVSRFGGTNLFEDKLLKEGGGGCLSISGVVCLPCYIAWNSNMALPTKASMFSRTSEKLKRYEHLFC